jgi:DNA repair protein RecO (recombination protein O)
MAAPRAPLAAYVLHHWDWSETSLILDLFTREQGRVAVAAKGAKRPYSQLRPVLLPFQRLHVQLGRLPTDADGGELQTLRSAEWAGGAPMITGEALFSGFYLNELLMKLLARHDPHAALFDAYAATLPALAAADDAATQAALRAFELVLLREIGLLPDLRRVSATLEPVTAGRGYALRPETGVAASNDDLVIGGDQLLALQAALDGGRLDALRAACAGALAPLRTQLRTLLHYHLGSPHGLRTRSVMVEVQKLLDTVTSR